MEQYELPRRHQRDQSLPCTKSCCYHEQYQVPVSVPGSWDGDQQPVRFIVNDRRLLTVGWFGERKILFQLIIHDRIRASEHAEIG